MLDAIPVTQRKVQHWGQISHDATQVKSDLLISAIIHAQVNKYTLSHIPELFCLIECIVYEISKRLFTRPCINGRWHTHTQPFYSLLDFVQDYLDKTASAGPYANLHLNPDT